LAARKAQDLAARSALTRSSFRLSLSLVAARSKDNERLFPNFVRGATAVGLARLRAIAKAAKVATDDLPQTDAAAIARRLLEGLPEPAFFLHHVKRADEMRMAEALGLPDPTAWAALNPVTAEIRAMPSYRQPSWQREVWNAFSKKLAPERAKPRATSARDPHHAAQWKELGDARRWAKLNSAVKMRLSAELAKALGEGFAPDPEAAGHSAVRDLKTGVRYVAIAGGSRAMGLSKEEQTQLRKLLKAEPNAEAVELLKGYAAQTRPERVVTVPPFLCARTTLLEAQVAGQVEVDCANVHHVARISRERAAACVRMLAARLLSEAEWEWVARAGGARQWLVNGEAPRAGIAALAASRDLAEDEHPWGVSGLAWGSWVDDAWQPTYKKAPVDGSAFSPLELPETVRGGGLEVWPWQGSGELLSTHASSRDLDRLGDHALLVALDLPPRG
jgi:hypothetical protein